MDVTETVQALADLAWPVLIGIVVWRLLPTIRNIANSRGFTIRAGSAEISVQQASDQMLGRIENLREQVSVLKLQVAGMEGSGSAEALPIASGVSQLHRILWVDDYPDNNAYEVEALQRKGVVVDLARSTAEAMRAVGRAPQPYDAVITDMGREEHGEARPQAGLQLIRGLREQDVTSPVIVYASACAVGGAREELAKLGVQGTSSATVLLEILGRLAPR